MSLFSKTVHHFHVRKRIHQNLEPYPHPDKWKNFLDKAIYVVGISGPIMTMPQLFKIWVEKDASGISLISWSWYLLTAIVWLVYAITHKEKPLIITNSLWIIVEIFIVIGIV
ncbi:MAG: hypothetical protein KC550_04325, partial [Nanoarchaeota archaeon]|nr:hypothetical protein [Nanoarchaeota archaeon]